MGSVTELKFKNYILLWSKNHLFSNDGMGLFQPNDKKFLTRECPYGTDGKYPIFSKKLSALKDRLDLLGHTLYRAEMAIKESIHEDISLEEFIKVLSFINFDTEDTELDYELDFKPTKDSMRYENLWELGGFILKAPKAIEILKKYQAEDDYLQDRTVLDPLLILRCLAEIEKHSESDLVWEYYDLVLGGWIEEKDIQIREETPQFLILTEGKTDTDIIKKSLQSFRPDISDLFFFADTENHPFGGTNDIAKFMKGLIDIKYQVKAIVVLDNDLAGNDALKKIKQYNSPLNFAVLTLPEYEDFSSMETIGTNGNETMDINGKAVAIECFLDLSSIEEDTLIRWTNWDEKNKKYHGRFDNRIKNALKTKFDESYQSGFKNYDTKKLEFLINYILEKAIKLNKT